MVAAVTTVTLTMGDLQVSTLTLTHQVLMGVLTTSKTQYIFDCYLQTGPDKYTGCGTNVIFRPQLNLCNIKIWVD